ncbi:LuxR C-terminal-related transcriptional regulator [Hyphomonas sp. WL0036]|uniref:response regulator transcription factor n=1 Tax=Hyphomonas sediminis TaxID=2866160 RepID=UPI001C7F08CE|nr:LuxR C-terminal-related transcriptional regulator [Hyphomonas sediminis]MBY9068135.1 LuxR C-terminal-related transcriptional regulator [Hyphomonas sediminis]
MKKLTPFASRIHKPNRLYLQRSSVRLHASSRRTLSPPVPQDQTPPTMIRIVVETDRADVARMIKLNLPEGSHLSISQLKHPSENASKPLPASHEREVDPTIFTTRQTDVIRLLITGLANKEIGRSLGLSHFTVRNHVSQIFRLLGVSTRKDAILHLKTLSLYKELY